MSTVESSSSSISVKDQASGVLVPNRVFVSRISSRTTAHGLGALFSKFGEVVDAKIILDSAGVSKGYGFVTFDTEEEALRSLKDSDDLILNERKLNVGRAIKKQPTGRAQEENLSQTTSIKSSPMYFDSYPFYPGGDQMLNNFSYECNVSREPLMKHVPFTCYAEGVPMLCPFRPKLPNRGEQALIQFPYEYPAGVESLINHVSYDHHAGSESIINHTPYEYPSGGEPLPNQFQHEYPAAGGPLINHVSYEYHAGRESLTNHTPYEYPSGGKQLQSQFQFKYPPGAEPMINHNPYEYQPEGQPMKNQVAQECHPGTTYYLPQEVSGINTHAGQPFCYSPAQCFSPTATPQFLTGQAGSNCSSWPLEFPYFPLQTYPECEYQSITQASCVEQPMYPMPPLYIINGENHVDNYNPQMIPLQVPTMEVPNQPNLPIFLCA